MRSDVARITNTSVQILVIAVLVFGAILVLGPIRAEVERRVEAVKADVIDMLETATGREIRYGSIAPSIFRYVEVADLEILASGSPDPLLTINRIRIYYDIFALLSGDIDTAVSEISLEDTEFVLDLEADRDLVALFQDLGSAGGTGTSIVPENARIAGRNLSVDLRFADARVRTSNLSFRAGLNDESIDLRTEAQAFLSLRALGEQELATDFSASGRIAMDLTEAGVTVQLGTLETEAFRLRGQSYYVRYEQNSISLTKVADRAPVDIEAMINLDTEILTASFTGSNFVAGDILQLGGNLEEANRWLQMGVSGQGSAELNFAEGTVAYQGNLTGRIPAAVAAGGFIAELLGPTLPLQGTAVRASFSGDTDAILIDNARASGEFGAVGFSGAFVFSETAPRGELIAENLDVFNLPIISGTAYISPSTDPQAATLVLETQSLDIGEMQGLSGRVRILPDGQTAAYNGYLSLEPGTAEAAGTLDLVSGDFSEIDLVLTNTTPAAILPGLRTIAPDVAADLPEELPNNIVFTTSAVITVEPSAAVYTDRISFYLADDPAAMGAGSTDPAGSPFRGTMSADLQGTELRIPGFSLAVGDLRFNGGADLDLGADRPFGFETAFMLSGIDLDFAREEFRLSGTIGRDGLITVRGNYGLAADISIEPGGRFVVDGRADGVPLVFGDRQMRIDFDGVVTGSSTTDLSAEVDSLRLTNVPFVPEENAVLDVVGRLGTSGATVTDARFSDGTLDLYGSGSLTYDLEALLAGQTALSGELSIVGEAEGEQYQVAATISPSTDEAVGPTVDASVEIAATPIATLVESPFEGNITGRLAVTGPLSDPTISGSLALDRGSLNDERIAASTEFELSGSRLTLAGFEAEYIDNRIVDAAVTVNGTTGLVTADFDFRNDAEEEPTIVAVFGFLQFDTDPDPPTGTSPAAPAGAAAAGDAAPTGLDPVGFASVPALLERDFAGTLNLDGVPFGGELGGLWELAVNRTGGLLRVEGGPGNSVAATLDEQGFFTVQVGPPFPLSFEGEGTFADGSLEADLSPVLVNAADVLQMLDFGGLIIDSGSARGNLRITGPITDPEFYGTLTAGGVGGSLSLIPERLGPAQVSFVFEEKTLRMFPTTIPVGASEANIEGVFAVSRWTVDSYQVSVTMDPRQVIPARARFGGIAVDGFARGDLVIQGDRTGMSVAGAVTAESTVMTLAPPEQQTDANAAADQPQSSLFIDVSVISGRNVQFLWPNRELPVLRGTAAVGEQIDVYMSTDEDDFALVGDVEVSGGELFYYDRSFFIREGVIRFNETEDAFDPRVSVRAEVRDIGAEGPVRISLVTENSPLSNLAVRFESDANLTEQEILAILGGAIFSPRDGPPLNLGEAVLLTGDIVSQFGLVRSFENTVREALQLDLFALRTRVFGNIFRGVFDAGADPLDSGVPSLGQYLDNTTLFLGKYLGPDVFLELLVQLRARTLAAETLLNIGGIGGVAIDSELSLEFETPFFLLEWNFSPRSPENLFLTDNIFSFTWEFSY